MPLSLRVCNVATETEEALAMWLALWLRCIIGGHQRVCKLGPFVPKMLPYRDRAEGEWGSNCGMRVSASRYTYPEDRILRE